MGAVGGPFDSRLSNEVSSQNRRDNIEILYFPQFLSSFKGSLHHTHDVSLEDAFCIIHMAAGFYF